MSDREPDAAGCRIRFRGPSDVKRSVCEDDLRFRISDLLDSVERGDGGLER